MVYTSRMKAMIVLEVVSAVMLSITTLFSYVHAQYATAIIAAACAGFVAGLMLTRLIARRWLRSN